MAGSAKKILKRCRLPLTAKGRAGLIITEMCVMEVTPGGLLLTELNPEFSLEDLRGATEADFMVSKALKAMEA